MWLKVVSIDHSVYIIISLKIPDVVETIVQLRVGLTAVSKLQTKIENPSINQ